MMRITASAPGKVVLSGEYAVLDGAPAVSMAVDRRAIAELAPATGPACSVTAPGHAPEPGRFVIESGGFRWLEGGDRFAVVENVCRAGACRFPGAVDIVLDTRAFADSATGSKIGIGSSAAVTAALAAAFAALAGETGDIAAVAIEAHRALQGGGSGVDVATAVSGGLIEYRMPGTRRRALVWPEDLHFALYWSGVGSDTARRLERLRLAGPRPSRGVLVEAASSAAAAWRSGASLAILDALGKYAAALARFDADHDIGIFDAGHGALAAAAPDGIVYKPCGAGGGDVGVALTTDAGALAAFTETARRHGFSYLPIALDPEGVSALREPR
jgi:phosphomevalonate kinase